MSKKIKQKADCLVRVINENNPEKYIKSKFNDFLIHFVYDMDEDSESDNISPFLVDQDYNSLLASMQKVDIFGKIEPPRHLFFAFGVFIFRAYLRYSLNISKLTQNNMVRFNESIESEMFKEDSIKKLSEYFLYFKRKGNETLERQELESLNKRFYFIKDLMRFDFKMEIPESAEISKEDLNSFITQSYKVFMEAIMLNFSNLLNFMNGLAICGSVEPKAYNGVSEKKQSKKEKENA